MSEKEYKIKCENLFKKNTILINQQAIDAEQIRALQNQNGELTDKVNELEAQIEKMQEKLKADFIAELKEQMQYSTSPSCTKGMELFIKSIEKWEIKEND